MLLPAAFTAGDVVERELAIQLANQGRDDFVDIAHQTVVGIVEDWRIFIFINGDNHFCAVAANHMLDLPEIPSVR